MLRENELQDISDKVYLICKSYVYDSISYWDKEKKQPRSKRKLIGKIDPETGEIVPTSPRKKKSDQSEGDYKKLYESALKDISAKDQRISELESSIAAYSEREESLLQQIDELIMERLNEIQKESRV